jgi:hypothetical protein
MAAAGRMLQERVGNEFHVKKDQTKKVGWASCLGKDLFFSPFQHGSFCTFFPKTNAF